MKLLRAWILYFLSGLLVGFCLGFILYAFWVALRIVIFGYYDSGPSWVNTVSYSLIIFGVFLCIAIGQKMFFDKFVNMNREK